MECKRLPNKVHYCTFEKLFTELLRSSVIELRVQQRQFDGQRCHTNSVILCYSRQELSGGDSLETLSASSRTIAVVPCLYNNQVDRKLCSRVEFKNIGSMDLGQLARHYLQCVSHCLSMVLRRRTQRIPQRFSRPVKCKLWNPDSRGFGLYTRFYLVNRRD